MRWRTALSIGAAAIAVTLRARANPESETEPPVTQSAATQAADDVNVARLKAAVDRVIPKDVREGKREPTDREKLAQHFLLILVTATNGLNADNYEKNQKNQKESDEQLEQQFKKARSKYAHSSTEALGELKVIEDQTREKYHLLDFLHRPPKFPTTQASEQDLVRRIEQIPGVLDRSEYLARELPYHGKRLDLLDQINDLKQSKAAEASTEAAKKLAALGKLLAATDAAHAAEIAADRFDHPTTEPGILPGKRPK